VVIVAHYALICGLNGQLFMLLKTTLKFFRVLWGPLAGKTLIKSTAAGSEQLADTMALYIGRLIGEKRVGPTV